jgi:uncharacterized membrane protein
MTRTTTKDRRRRTRGTDDGGGGGSRRRAQGGGGRRRRRDEEDEAGRRGRDADDEARSRGRDAGDEARSRAPRDVDQDEFLDREDDDGERDDDDRQDGGSGGGVFAELKNVAADAALAVLAPVAKKAATGAAKYAVKKAPELLEDTVKPMLEDAGGVKGLVGQAMSSDGPAGGLLSKLTPGGDTDDDGGKQGAGDGTGKGRRMPIQQAVDVAAPIDIVYDQWTQFEDYPKFMHRVQRVEQRDESHVAFHAKVWGINRMWEAEIVEQRPDERIVFKSVNGVQLTGVVTFHDMAERLTRIELNIDVDPDGPIEKIARGARMVKRAARGDLKRFKAYVEMHEDETGAWRGEIQDGDVVSEPDDEQDDDERYEEDDERAEASYDEQEPDDGADEDDEQEPEGRAADDEAADDEDDEPDEKPAPARKRTRSTASKAKSSSTRSRANGGDPGKSKTGSRAKASSSSRSRGSSKSASSRKRTTSKSGSKR